MKKTKEYLPRRISELDAWESNFLEKVKTIGAELKYTPEEITKITAAIAAHRDAFQAMNISRQDAAQIAADYEVKSQSTIAMIRKFVQNIKSNSLYNEAMGSALGVITTSTTDNEEEKKPQLKVTAEGGTTFVRFKKKGFAGVKLFCKRGDELNFTLLGLYLSSPFKDSRTNLVEGKHEKREYFAYYFDKEEQVGQPSDIASIVL